MKYKYKFYIVNYIKRINNYIYIMDILKKEHTNKIKIIYIIIYNYI